MPANHGTTEQPPLVVVAAETRLLPTHWPRGQRGQLPYPSTNGKRGGEVPVVPTGKYKAAALREGSGRRLGV